MISATQNKTRTQLDRLLKPRSIVLVGASSTPGSLGESVLLNLEKAGYKGELYLINPKRPVIHGITALGSIDELPKGVDCAVMAIPGHAVVAGARACAEREVGGVIIFSAGFAEAGEAGKAAQLELASIARESGMIIEGPNCLGMVNYVDGIPLTFVVTPPQEQSETPGVAMISQSGAMAAVLGVNMRHHAVKLTYSVSTGNEAASGIEDYLEHMIGDPGTRVVALLAEQLRQPKRFLELARRAQEAGKYLVLLHPGSSSAARASAATHTGAMAGDYEVMHTLVTHAGVIHVETIEELVDVSQILTRIGELPRAGAAVFTESGAFKALTLDLCERIGLELPKLSPAAESALKAALPAFIPPSNPLDITAQGLVDTDLYRRTLPPFLDDEQFGSVFMGIIFTDPATTNLKLPPILEAFRAIKPTKPAVFAALDEGAPFDAAGIQELRQLGVPCFPSPERALRALARVTARGRREFRRAPAHARSKPLPSLDQGTMSEYRSKEVLKSFDIPFPEGGMARNVDEALAVARRIGFPVVLKAQAAALSHKTEAGGVILGIENDSSLAEGWSKLHNNIKASRPGLELDGVLVERMGQRGTELIIGLRNDPDWGPVLLAGFGGVLAEALRDVRLMPADLPMEEIVKELGALRCATLFHGFRGSPPLDVEAAARILFALGEVARCYPNIEEIDINPVVIYAKGQGGLALDALISVAKI